MNDGMFIAIRAELQEANSLSKQILDELRRINAPATQPATPAPVAVPADAVGPVTVETVEMVDSGKAAKKGK